MRGTLTETALVLQGVFRRPSSFTVFFLVALGFFALAVLLPSVTIPGNSVTFQLSIYAGRDYILLILLSVLAGLHGALLARSWQQRRSRLAFTGTASGGASGLFAAIIGTAACSSCIASLFALVGLGTGSVLFVLEYRALFLAAAIAIMLISLYFTARNARACCSTAFLQRDFGHHGK